MALTWEQVNNHHECWWSENDWTLQIWHNTRLGYWFRAGSVRGVGVRGGGVMAEQLNPDSGVSEWQRSVRYTYWHEPSNMVIEVTELGNQFTWQVVDYMGGWHEKRDKWEVEASSDLPLDTLEEAQAAALAWLESDEE